MIYIILHILLGVYLCWKFNWDREICGLVMILSPAALIVCIPEMKNKFYKREDK